MKERCNQKNRYVYLLGILEHRYYKIGYSNDVYKRYSNVKTAIPFDVDLLFFIKSEKASEIESYMHFKYDRYRKNGEWFGFNQGNLIECLFNIIYQECRSDLEFNYINPEIYINTNWYRNLNHEDNLYKGSIHNYLLGEKN